MKTFNVKCITGLLGKAGVVVKARSSVSLKKRLGGVQHVVKITEMKK